MTLLSIIIPVYNGKQYIRTLVESIEINNLDLTDQLELIIVNDGSSDDSYAVCEYLAFQWSNVKAYTKTNGGIASARQYGLEQATGMYITFCDQDDKVTKGYADFLKKIENRKADILCSNYITTDEDGNTQMYTNFTVDKLYEGKDCKNLAKLLFGGPFLLPKDKRQDYPQLYATIWNCLFKRQLIVENQLRIKNWVAYEDDWAFLVSCFCRARSIFFTSDFYYSWTINTKSRSHTYKFIPDYFTKSQGYIQWGANIADLLNLDDHQKQDHILVHKDEVVTRGFENCVHQSFDVYFQEIKTIKFSRAEMLDMNRYNSGYGTKILVSLLAYHCYLLAFFYAKILDIKRKCFNS